MCWAIKKPPEGGLFKQVRNYLAAGAEASAAGAAAGADASAAGAGAGAATGAGAGAGASSFLPQAARAAAAMMAANTSDLFMVFRLK